MSAPRNKSARTSSRKAKAAPVQDDRRGLRVVTAKYDAALRNATTTRHWAGADGYSPDDANRPEVRKILRERCRYEVANNSYARGIVETLANDLVGTGPGLQLLVEQREVASDVEGAWDAWSRAVCLPEKLRLMRMARAESGECFGVMVTNPRIAGDIKLDLQLYEPEQVESIEYDDLGNPISYSIFDQYPGSGGAYAPKSSPIDASKVIHFFAPKRPGQRRGIPDIVPSLFLFNQLRRYSLAVLDAAETVANHAGVIYTDAPAGGEADSFDANEVIPLERNTFVSMPAGWKLTQLKAEQPTTTYPMFKGEILNEIARCLQIPFNLAAGNSSGYNYASGRLDFQNYHRSIRVERQSLGDRVLDRLLAEFLREYRLSRRPTIAFGDVSDIPHQWVYDGNEHVDPLKEANAQGIRLANLTTTLADEYAKQGKDWQAELKQIAAERKLLRTLGIASPEAELVDEEPEPKTEEDE